MTLEGSIGRRELGKLAAASLALGGLGACGQRPRERIVPYVKTPASVVPGVPSEYATSMVLDGFAIGLIAESHEGRPTKLRGNPEHPASLGGAGALEQASVLSLYDPDRLRTARGPEGTLSLERLLAGLARACTSGLPPWFVIPPQSSPSFARAWARFVERVPNARVSVHAPLDRGELYAASRAAFGRELEVQYRFEQADVIFALGADFTADMPMSLRFARDFASRRRPSSGGAGLSRLYVAEAAFTPTGTLADHHLAVRPSAMARLAADVLLRVARRTPDRLPDAFAQRRPTAGSSATDAFAELLGDDLTRAGKRALVVAGPAQPFAVHLLAHALNVALGAQGHTFFLTEPALLTLEGATPLAELTRVDPEGLGALVFAGTNPLYTAPELELEHLLATAPETYCLARYEHETARACRHIVPESHYLESWGDARAYDGTESLVQPLIEPLLPALSLLELVAASGTGTLLRGHELVRETRRAQRNLARDFEQAWSDDLTRGFVPNTAAGELPAALAWESVARTLDETLARPASRGLELGWRLSPTVHDGSFTQIPWLLELPHPLTKQCWGNAALLAPDTARELGVTTGQVVELAVAGKRLETPVLVMPGVAPRTVLVELGFGQTTPGLISHAIGVNALALGTGSRAGGAALEVSPRSRHEALAITQEHAALERMRVPLSTTLAALNGGAPSRQYRHEDGKQRLSLLPAHRYEGVQWAMTIDTTLCTGCNACVIACQAENNVPVVGADGVRRSREMHWLRIDRYFVGSPDRPRIVNQPMACQHCEKAPCEYVCPVNATVHSPDGLNEMVYNRCIGTRFCSNNCPYKVRRFNWFDFSAARGPEILQRNPQVTVRQRGVMEKCSYCVQRIRRAEIRAREEDRAIRPGEVVTACQETCPTRAIEFGSLDDRSSLAVRLRSDPRAYDLFAELGTRPRTRYLAKVENPHPGSTS
ncbi:MAG TPA: 4Fe-4S dicluster domain-containing protein [Polyangiaceae bacterium]|nr:4Fe-4S dicluster domain-containing protein [Polyangiaceae bacterium]